MWDKTTSLFKFKIFKPCRVLEFLEPFHFHNHFRFLGGQFSLLQEVNKRLEARLWSQQSKIHFSETWRAGSIAKKQFRNYNLKYEFPEKVVVFSQQCKGPRPLCMEKYFWWNLLITTFDKHRMTHHKTKILPNLNERLFP